MSPNNGTSTATAPACRFSIQAVISGFPIQLEGETTNASNLLSLIEKLRSVGAEPPAPPPAVNQTSQAPAASDEAPICSVHSTPMKKSNFGGFHCTKRDQSGSFCKEKSK